MIASKTTLIRCLVFLVALAGITVPLRAEDTDWKSNNDAGDKAYDAGRYAECEQFWTTALKNAEESGAQDRRLATSLNNLGLLYDT